MSYDAADQEVYFFGGEANYTWAFSGGSWSAVNVSYGGRWFVDSGLAYDAAQGALVGYSFYNATNISGRPVYIYNTSVFEDDNWTFVGSFDSPVEWNEVLSYDPNLNGVITTGRGSTTWFWGSARLSVGGVQANPSSTDAGAPVQFSAQTYGGDPPYSYNWSFGDGATSSSVAPIHSYSGTGSFNVSVRVTDTNGTGVVGYSVVSVGPTPAATFLALPNPTEAGIATQFNGTRSGGIGPYAFAWNFGDGNASNASSPGTCLHIGGHVRRPRVGERFSRRIGFRELFARGTVRPEGWHSRRDAESRRPRSSGELYRDCRRGSRPLYVQLGIRRRRDWREPIEHHPYFHDQRPVRELGACRRFARCRCDGHGQPVHSAKRLNLCERLRGSGSAPGDGSRPRRAEALPDTPSRGRSETAQ